MLTKTFFSLGDTHTTIGQWLTYTDTTAVMCTSKESYRYYRRDLIWKRHAETLRITPKSGTHLAVCQVVQTRMSNVIPLLHISLPAATSLSLTNCSLKKLMSAAALLPVHEQMDARSITNQTCRVYIETVLMGHPACDRYRGCVALAATQENHLEMALTVLSQGSVSINDTERGVLVKYFASRTVQTIQHHQFILGMPSLHEKSRDLHERCPERVMHLISAGTISEAERGEAVISGATQCYHEGYLEMTRALLNLGSLSMVDRGSAVVRADGHLELLTVLLSHGRIHELDRSIAVNSIVDKNGSCRALKALLDHGPITRDVRGKAVVAAIKKERLDMVAALLLHGDISQKDSGNALSYAAHHGYARVTSLLLIHGNISENDRVSAMQLALSRGHLKVAQLLKRQSSVCIIC